jgi:choline dehydrogenase-like flavoprotein
MPLTDDRRAVLRAVCDTVVPSIEHAPDPTGFWARKASDIGVDQAFEQMLAEMPEADQAGIAELLDGLYQQGFLTQSQLSREQLLRNIALLGPEAAAGVGALQGLTLFLHYGMPVDPQTGQNPNWAQFGYPGPVTAPPQAEKPIRPVTPQGDTTLEADVVIVGSGAGGGVIAGTLARQGLKVVVVEAGGYFSEPDFAQLELKAYQDLYWRGGPTPTADMNITLQAGSTLGGGTVVNWTNSLRTKPWVREQWAQDFGLEGLDGPEFDRHIDAIFARIKVTDTCSDFNRPHQRMQAGAEALGWSFKRILRNADPETYDPAMAGYMGFGDVSGSKQSTQKTYLQDAVENGAEVLVRTTVERVLVEDGRAAGVEGVYSDPATGATAKVTVRAPRVVVAAGALETPAVLLRSGIGGPAAGDYLRLHPAWAVLAMYGDDMQAWWGSPQSGLIDEFVNAEDDHGFLIEGAQYTTGLGASAVPFTSAADHKAFMADYRHGGTMIALIRDRGHGRVTLDADGNGVPWYSITDELDIRNIHRGTDALIRLHQVAGAHLIAPMAAGMPIWRTGDDLEAFIRRANRIPLRAGGMKLFSAHQMGSARMGSDPATSVANPWGELHDTPGVWIGDASAFPTPSGTNPMITIMALAHRTAEAITGVTETPDAALAGAAAK